ncbi:MAG: hypothetical protein IJO91_00045 [Oscillospiraceae bacterium]|nr:hypothetical protein [Oscillospiraceae bacterium]
MKKYLLPVVLCLLMLTGCAGNAPAVTVENGRAELPAISAAVQFPEGWSIYTGDALYEQIYKSYSDSFSSPEEMQELLAESGLTYLAYGCSADLDSIVNISVQDMSADVSEYYDLTTEEYAHTSHDSTIFSYQASGYKVNDSDFSEKTLGEHSGYLSRFEISSTDEQAQFVIGMSEFMFDHDGDVYTIQVCYSNEDSKTEALSVLDNFTAVQGD